ncbi:MAG: succinate dehydrogenase/fumarate reductase iron-sulfur subunit, partial [Acidobacteria bacterium]
MRISLDIWRQKNPRDPGHFERHELADISEHMSFLEMLDVLNQRLVTEGKEPVAFDSDCREGICGMCGFLINGEAHGPLRNATVCQLHMRHFKDGDNLRLE